MTHTEGQLQAVELKGLGEQWGLRVKGTEFHYVATSCQENDEANMKRLALCWNTRDSLHEACEAVVTAADTAPPVELIQRLSAAIEKCREALKNQEKQ